MTTEKQVIRAEIRKRISLLTPEERLSKSTDVCQQLLADPQLSDASRIGVYLALPDEVDLSPVIRIWLSQGKELATPVFRSSEWRFERLSDLRKTDAGAYDIQEPVDADPVHTDSLEVIIVPGRAFTSNGQRLGRGKGIYDRLLSAYNGGCIGAGFHCQVVPTLPTEQHDRIMTRVYAGNPQGSQ